MARLREDTVVAARKPQGWAATIALQDAWKAAGALRGIPTYMSLAGPDLRPLPPFLGLWRAAFPGTIAPMANEPLFTRSGVASDSLLRAFRALP